jgi:hypothetical protein
MMPLRYEPLDGDALRARDETRRYAARMPRMPLMLVVLAFLSMMAVVTLMNNKCSTVIKSSSFSLAPVPACNDPWGTGFLVNDTTWRSTVERPCPFEYYSKALISGTEHQHLLEPFRNKSVIMIGDSLDRNLATIVCEMPQFERIDIMPPSTTERWDGGYPGRHVLCRHKRLNFVVGSFFTYALKKDMSQEILAEIQHHPWEPRGRGIGLA